MAEERYAILNKAHEDARRIATQGLVASVLANYRLTKEESDEQAAASKKPKAMKKKKKQTDSEVQSKRRIFFHQPGDDSESDGPVKKAKGAMSTIPGGNAVRNGGSGGGSKSGAASSSGAPGTAAGSSAGSAAAGSSKGPGAPKKEVQAMCEKIWEDFCKCDEHGAYFNKESSRATKQFVIRWANVLRTKIDSFDDADKLKVEAARDKHCYLVDTVETRHCHDLAPATPQQV